MRTVRFQLFCLIIFLFSLTNTVQGSNIIPSSLDYMAGFAGTIVTGSVVGQTSYWENNVIYTDIVLSVEDVLKKSGDPMEYIAVKVRGGQVGEYHLVDNDSPTFKPEEKAMLFLVEHSDEHFIFGLNYGLFRITVDPESGQELINGPLFEKDIVNDLEIQRTKLNLYRSDKVTLEDFSNQVRTLLEKE